MVNRVFGRYFAFKRCLFILLDLGALLPFLVGIETEEAEVGAGAGAGAGAFPVVQGIIAGIVGNVAVAVAGVQFAALVR